MTNYLQDIEIGTTETATIETGVEAATTTIFRFEEHQKEIDLKDVIRIIEIRLGVDIKIGITIKMYFKPSSVPKM
jgi:hypothetical protein